ncbi:FlgB family protein [Xinfangfangia sp. CPCC 101601]|uniref:FlgB family protein n=1 Tax=Pseudogemmobacter lacusdianii TaxID=3069608 RepID=A0ABU0VU90_9RHOB|nr:FlgB family protein [Xinfangfangia sp. CPCC 101601]MDQ2065302.1 FlgB family protein [Xinfangfangia sp. CPCC 101601]
MFEKLEITRMAQSLAAQAGARLGLIAQNIAHSDTPGYKAQDLPDFARIWAQSSGTLRATRPGHLQAPSAPAVLRSFASGGSEAPNGNSVSLEREMVKMAETRQDHEMALAIYRNTSDVMRTALGRQR